MANDPDDGLTTGALLLGGHLEPGKAIGDLGLVQHDQSRAGQLGAQAVAHAIHQIVQSGRFGLVLHKDGNFWV